MSVPKTLRFGIQSLDKLVGSTKIGKIEKYGVDLVKPESTNGKQKNPRKPAAMTSSICLTGPDGMGKSVFSLHLVSHYLADCLSAISNGKKNNYSVPRVLYISTDLSYTMALKGWKDFALNTPLNRREPLLEIKKGRETWNGTPIEIELKQYLPTENSESEKSVVNYLETPHCRSSPQATAAEVCFVDLASRTAGDDWGFLHRLLSLLEEPADHQPRHLVVIDAVEGFETLVGDLNAFGEESSRRSRIAQVMRLVAGKSHLLMVVEEARNERFPEEFVTDVVIRLRNVDTGRYLRRTVEVEKSRGQFHIRGQHSFVIRDGRGSTTGNQPNADDPEVYKINSSEVHQSYVHVFPSLNYLSREKMMDTYNPREALTDGKFAAFGIPYLDNMLGGNGPKAENRNGYDTRGLPCGSATALIGDSLTQKGQLGKAFLSRAFYPYAQKLRTIAATAEDEIDRSIKRVANSTASARVEVRRLEQYVNSLIERLRQDTKRPGEYHPVTILFTTQDVNHGGLSDEFYQWLRDDDIFFIPSDIHQTAGEENKDIDKGSVHRLQRLTSCLASFARDYRKYTYRKRSYERIAYERFKSSRVYKRHRGEFKELLIEDAFENELKTYIREHTICRRFEIHDLPAAILMNLLHRNIETAQRLMFGLGPNDGPLPAARKSFQNSQRIRVVIDDLNGLRNAYPEMREDPLMLPALLFMLGREGVTSLIIDTQASGSPELSISERFESSVRELVQHRIYIWRLPFYGENRVAISLIPPISHEYRGLIRELRWETKDGSRTDRALTVDPHFELYMGLEKGQPRPVPLEVRLYAETPSVEKYIVTEEQLLREVFAVVPTSEQSRVIIKAEANDYDALRDACHLQRGTRLDHTTILQANEFWWLRRPRQRRAGGFRHQWDYLNSVTATLKGDRYQSEPVVDPFWVFQLPPEKKPYANAGNGFIKTKKRANEIRRLDLFDTDCSYNLTKVGKEEQQSVDRVPYTWDFGFLLCNGDAWEKAFPLPIGKDSSGRTITVEKMWNTLYRATKDSRQNAKTPKSMISGSVRWRDFLAASKVVAESQSYLTSAPATAFDFTMLIPESFSCLILEMWLSESYDSLERYRKRNREKKVREDLERRKTLLRGIGERHWHLDENNPLTLLGGLEGDKGLSLQEILTARHDDRDIRSESFSLELYKVWLLLTEAINFEELVDSSSHLNFEFKSRDVSPQAVSARHWYKTASKFIDSLRPEQLEFNWVPVRLPGHFSVRADWFLAVGGGSRSSRLADHALDLLSSRRSNVTRLQEGIGLPTRTLFDTNANSSRLRTRLVAAPQSGEPLANVEYDLLRQIGAGTKSKQEEEFYWLWRSRLRAYNRHSRVWHKWLNRALLWWHSWHQRYRSKWKNGFDVYDRLTEIEFGDGKNFTKRLAEFKELDSWNKFDALRDILIAELEQINISTV